MNQGYDIQQAVRNKDIELLCLCLDEEFISDYNLLYMCIDMREIGILESLIEREYIYIEDIRNLLYRCIFNRDGELLKYFLYKYDVDHQDLMSCLRECLESNNTFLAMIVINRQPSLMLEEGVASCLMNVE